MTARPRRAASARRGILAAATVAGIATAIAAALALATSSAAAQSAPAPTSPSTGSAMSSTITGPFEVKMTPQPTVNEAAQFGRFALDKTYHGDLEATAAGEMLAVMTGEKGSAGYVAVERVTGTLAGRKGTFALQHSATMNRGTPDLTIVVVPDSGTGDLTGLSGTMTIDIQPGGKHVYGFTYALPPATK
jgi:hypothetical protein